MILRVLKERLYYAGRTLGARFRVRTVQVSLGWPYPFEAKEDPMPRPAVEHTLALARLRQGKPGEVEPLCASGLAGDNGPDARATILATIAPAAARSASRMRTSSPRPWPCPQTPTWSRKPPV